MDTFVTKCPLKKNTKPRVFGKTNERWRRDHLEGRGDGRTVSTVTWELPGQRKTMSTTELVGGELRLPQRPYCYEGEARRRRAFEKHAMALMSTVAAI